MKPPPKVYLIDTNVILRFLLADHPLMSPRAETFMTSVAQGRAKACLLEGVLVELVHVLVKFYQVPKADVAEKLAAILNFTGIVNADRPALLNALAKYAVTGADIVDCLLAAKSSAATVVCSFDKDMGRLNASWEEPD